MSILLMPLPLAASFANQQLSWTPDLNCPFWVWLADCYCIDWKYPARAVMRNLAVAFTFILLISLLQALVEQPRTAAPQRSMGGSETVRTGVR
jgi:hypothetical protein